LDEENIKLLTFGPHENFYRDLKRQSEWDEELGVCMHFLSLLILTTKNF
jgi:hypothetical protein